MPDPAALRRPAVGLGRRDRARDRERDGPARSRAQARGRTPLPPRSATRKTVSRRVSIAALLLTMMLSFLGFVRANRTRTNRDDKLDVQQSKNDAATEWSLYQTKTAQRSGFIEAEDTLAREVLSLPPPIRAAGSRASITTSTRPRCASSTTKTPVCSPHPGASTAANTYAHKDADITTAAPTATTWDPHADARARADLGHAARRPDVSVLVRPSVAAIGAMLGVTGYFGR